MPRRFKEYREKFMGVVIAPVLGEVGKDGYGVAQSWVALDASEEVVHKAEKVTLVRRWIREQSKQSKQSKKSK